MVTRSISFEVALLFPLPREFAQTGVHLVEITREFVGERVVPYQGYKSGLGE